MSRLTSLGRSLPSGQRKRCESALVDAAHARLELLDALAERHELDPARDGGELDRDRLHVGPRQQRLVTLEARFGLALTEHRFAQKVQVHAHAFGAALCEVRAELGLLGGEHDAARLFTQTPQEALRSERWNERSGAQQELQLCARLCGQVARYAQGAQQLPSDIHDARRLMAAVRAVRQTGGEGLAETVVHQLRQLFLAFAFGRCRHRQAALEQAARNVGAGGLQRALALEPRLAAQRGEPIL
jgi:hypothetical protein